MFRNLIFLAMAVGAASMAGWFTVNREGDQTSIHFNRDEIRNDTRRVIDRGREYFDERQQRLASQQGSESQSPDDGYGQQTYQQQSYQQQDDSDPRYGNDARYGYPSDQYDRSQYGQPRYGQAPYGQQQYRETDYQQQGQSYGGNHQDTTTAARGGVRYGVPYQNELNR